jgi:hypothetical protein
MPVLINSTQELRVSADRKDTSGCAGAVILQQQVAASLLQLGLAWTLLAHATSRCPLSLAFCITACNCSSY